ncbi:gluconokinase [Herbiconiux sp. CPCC 203407]|uniref:Gluconokinase n=1 Tax=Herbiconiux oxytropis TaxID=2970915 RepID=A0AA41XIP6_9MICO|nr:gluconokinase [Herbiconiux oxytropis]MCS5722222.1 gluconokinase [Herbiconiux oxytropis]MCS5727140.1 gluconokinase [Herbiconiux oxytropis]
MNPPPALVVMGVSGSGKSTVGAALAEALGVPFVDADDLHPLTNIEKMRAGLPLDDDDRWPWLRAVGDAIRAASTGTGTGAPATGVVVACSALRVSYRDAILERAPRTRFVLLQGDREMLLGRLRSRTGHFMPASLLDSQLDALEPLGPHEPGLTVDAADTPEAVIAEVRGFLTRSPDGPQRIAHP